MSESLYSRGKPRPLEFAALEEPPWVCWCADQPRCCEIEGACCAGCENEHDYRAGDEDEDEGWDE